MSEIVAVLNEIVERHDCSHPAIVSKASAEITRLTAEVERLKKEIIGRQAHDRMQVREIEHLTAEVEKKDAALRECEAELNAYYRMKYPGGHPHSQKELAQAMASNPATLALKENSDDQGCTNRTR
jgi:dsDNA-specific endonuclease/ATPase MutS2